MKKTNLKLKPVPEPVPLLKLDLGCGDNKREGFKGVDFVKTEQTDYVHDLFTFPWPFKENSVEEVNCSHFFEHVPAKIRPRFMDELFRVLVPGGKAIIVTPYHTSVRATQDFTPRVAANLAKLLPLFQQRLAGRQQAHARPLRNDLRLRLRLRLLDQRRVGRQKRRGPWLRRPELRRICRRPSRNAHFTQKGGMRMATLFANGVSHNGTSHVQAESIVPQAGHCRLCGHPHPPRCLRLHASGQDCAQHPQVTPHDSRKRGFGLQGRTRPGPASLHGRSGGAGAGSLRQVPRRRQGRGRGDLRRYEPLDENVAQAVADLLAFVNTLTKKGP